jgi:hypothetical protein
MSRSGLIEDDGEDILAAGRWRGAVKSAINGKRGQLFLRELAAALDAMPEKVLVAGALQSDDCCHCTLGVIGHQRGLDMASFDVDDYDAIAASLKVNAKVAQEIMWENDETFDEEEYIWVEICGPMRKRCYETHWRDEKHVREVLVTKENVNHKRWLHMRAWVESNIKKGGTQ